MLNLLLAVFSCYVLTFVYSKRATLLQTEPLKFKKTLQHKPPSNQTLHLLHINSDVVIPTFKHK